MHTADRTQNEELFSDEATVSTAAKRTDTKLVEAEGLASRTVATTPRRGAE